MIEVPRIDVGVHVEHVATTAAPERPMEIVCPGSARMLVCPAVTRTAPPPLERVRPTTDVEVRPRTMLTRIVWVSGTAS